MSAQPPDAAGRNESIPGFAAIDVLLEAARRGHDRVHAAALKTEMADGALVVDTRPLEQRRRDGDLAGAVVIERNVLEWRLDPTCPHHIPQVKGASQRIIIICNEGYSSSLAAATLRQLGLLNATDLVGGFQAWKDLRRQVDGREGSPAVRNDPAGPR
jgi:rhodanese-related sulfurtransferase